MSGNDKENQKKIFNKKNAFAIVVFVLLTIICYLFPYTHDDWAWGTSIGLERLHSLFYKYNGRWVGNLLVLLLTRNRIVRTLTVSTVLYLIGYMITKLVNCKNKDSKYITIILLLLMPVNDIAQSIAWTSGFANYVPPVLIILVLLYLNKDIFENDKYEISNKLKFPMLLAGFCGSLFVEHVTIYNVILSIFIIGFNYFKNKKIILTNVFYAIGSVAGAILMFSNGAYYAIASSEDAYRTIEQGNIIIRAIKTYFNTLYSLFIYNNISLNLFISVLCLILIYRYMKNNKMEKTKRIILYCISFTIIVFCSYIVYIKIAFNSNIFRNIKHIKYLQGTLSALYYISIMLTTFFCTKDKNRKCKLLFYLISTLIIAGPLLVVTPIGPRCFYPTYVFLTIFAIDTFDYLAQNTEFDFSYIYKSIIIIIMIFFMFIYGQVFIIDNKRIEYINEHNNDKTLILPKLPYEYYMQNPNPFLDVFFERFKLFYNINKDSEIKFVLDSEWRKNEV